MSENTPTETLENSAKTQDNTNKPNRSFNKYKLGRPSKYKPIFCRGIIEYFTQDLYTERIKSTITQKNGSVVKNYELVPNPPQWFGAFAYSIGVSQQTLHEWKKSRPEFNEAFTRAKELQHEHIRSLGNMGLYNSNFAVFTMKNVSDWRDKKDLELSGKVDAQLFFAQMLVNGSDALANERSVLGNLN